MPRQRPQVPGRVPKRDEECVALHVDFDAIMTRKDVPYDLPVVCQGFAVGLRTELVQQPGRTLDIGEHEGHRARRQIAHRQDPR